VGDSLFRLRMHVKIPGGVIAPDMALAFCGDRHRIVRISELCHRRPRNSTPRILALHPIPQPWQRHCSAPSRSQRCRLHSPSATPRPSSCSPPPSTLSRALLRRVQANHRSLSINGNDAAIAQSWKIATAVTEALDKCPSRTYFVVRQEGVSSADYLDELSAPRLSHYLGGHNGVKSTMSVSETVGSVDAGIVSRHLQTKCGAQVIDVNLSSEPALPRRCVSITDSFRNWRAPTLKLCS
jgi:hypothetical protein